MGTVTESIGTTGRDFSTLQAWENAIPADISLATGTGDAYVGECYNDSEFTATLTIAGHTVDAVNFITLKCGTGQSFTDNANKATNALYYNQSNGVGVNVANDRALLIQDNRTVVQDIQWKNTGGGYNRPCVDISDLTNPATFQNCIAVMSSGSGAAISARDAVVRNCLAVNLGTGGGISHAFGGSSDSCTIVKPSNIGASGTGLSGGYGGAATGTNCAVFNFTTNFATTGLGITFTNCGTDGTAPAGVNNVGDLVYADTFEDDENDFRLKSGSGLLDVGLTSLTTDIVYQPRPGGSADDIGCWELQDAPPGGGAFPGWGPRLAFQRNRLIRL